MQTVRQKEKNPNVTPCDFFFRAYLKNKGQRPFSFYIYRNLKTVLKFKLAVLLHIYKVIFILKCKELAVILIQKQKY